MLNHWYSFRSSEWYSCGSENGRNESVWLSASALLSDASKQCDKFLTTSDTDMICLSSEVNNNYITSIVCFWEEVELILMIVFCTENRYKLPNGSLVIETVEHMRHQRSDQGKYQCLAKSLVQGNIISRKARLQVACEFLTATYIQIIEVYFKRFCPFSLEVISYGEE